jgi:hypothetical protein
MYLRVAREPSRPSGLRKKKQGEILLWYGRHVVCLGDRQMTGGWIENGGQVDAWVMGR